MQFMENHLQAWIEAAGIDAGPLFRAVRKGGRIGGALDRGDVVSTRRLPRGSRIARCSFRSDPDAAAVGLPRRPSPNSRDEPQDR